MLLDAPLGLLQASLFHEGLGGTLYTWGGVNESMHGSNEKRDSNKGCLGHGDADVLSGQLLPTRCAGPCPPLLPVLVQRVLLLLMLLLLEQCSPACDGAKESHLTACDTSSFA